MDFTDKLDILRVCSIPNSHNDIINTDINRLKRSFNREMAFLPWLLQSTEKCYKTSNICSMMKDIFEFAITMIMFLAYNDCVCAIKDELMLQEKDRIMSWNDTFFVDEIFKTYGNNLHNLYVGDLRELLTDLQMADSVDVVPRKKRDSALPLEQNITMQKCYTQTELLRIFKIRFDNGLSRDVFLRICPALLVQLDSKICPYDLKIEQASPKSVDIIDEIKRIPPAVWGYGIGSICAISVSGLIAVSFIPCLRRVLLNTVLQFLVALAIGALSGDAMIHLLPHAIGKESHPAVTITLKHDDADGAYMGLCGLAGIYLFYIISRLQAIIVRLKHDIIKMRERRRSSRSSQQKLSFRQYAVTTISDEQEAIEVLNQGDKDDKITGARPKKESDDEYHDHGHDRDIPRSARALALRVIIGDGIHNFSDGLAIGVAFADSIIGGFSTSVAVFCHELPHEMGDFAVLLKKGMTWRQALFYNCLSSVLSLIGMLIGLAVGNVGDMSRWLFLGIAGMFLYISLVDLLPEINMIETESKKRHPLLNLLYQLAGISLGITIMLLIALYEEDLKVMFGNH
ncbi:hypothetical protein FSP39_013330 [Pinctada imbricata]|uniref:Uncharacterized protein n=1 Tax=Pinctada imbricata TaxID=66713 RepID=A0AA88XWD4_PINIB|nr:hypothetical protein FSP39_013330 [Pinctada imbricata]